MSEEMSKAPSHTVNVLAGGSADYGMVPAGTPLYACVKCGAVVALWATPPDGGPLLDGRELHAAHHARVG
jgi:hypothetical protein